MMIRPVALALLLALSVSQAGANTDRQFVNGARDTASPPPPYSDAVLVGDTLYIAGHIGLDPKTGRAAEDPRIEAKLVMDSVKATVESAGLTMDDVVTMQIMCTDLGLYGTFNDVYRTYFSHGFPARAFLGVNALVLGAHFEVLGVAVRRHGKR